MKGTILEKIVEAKRFEVAAAKRSADIPALKKAAARSAVRGSHRLHKAISRKGRANIIAEFKRASPSKGVINAGLDPAEAAVSYKNAGGAAVSVLTDEQFFKGSLQDLSAVRTAVDLPVLRKDFVIDEFQIVEAAAAGADAVLLIASVLDTDKIAAFQEIAHSCGLDAIVEVHDLEELESAAAANARIIGVNNRNLKTFDVTLDVSRELILRRPAGSLMISESGITSAEEIRELGGLGFDGFLVGEALMRSGDARDELSKLCNAIG